MCAAAMFGRCCNSQSGKIDSARAIENSPRSKLPSGRIARVIGPTSSPTSTGVIPVPMQTPNRDGSSLEVSRPASSTARRRRPHREADRAAHQLGVLLVLTQIRA